MNKYNFIGDGKTKSFYFTFPFFTKNDVAIEINGKPATGFGLYCTSAGLNADIPFSGGKICFTKAPKATDVITIYRKLELNRIVDYQPAAKISPQILNQDMNFMLEVLKDMQNKLVEFAGLYSEITDKESTEVLFDKINTMTNEINSVISEITNVRTEIANLGDISSIQSSITTLNNSISNMNTSLDTANTNITTLNNFRDGVHDYVVEIQNPTADNNYTWYRKYQSGWIEQGGYVAGGGSGVLVTLIKTMSDTNYQINLTGFLHSGTAGNTASVSTDCGAITTTQFYVNNYVENGSNKGAGVGFWWTVLGIAE